jgi:hypothetical protein
MSHVVRRTDLCLAAQGLARTSVNLKASFTTLVPKGAPHPLEDVAALTKGCTELR